MPPLFVKAWRRKRHLTQEQLAARLETSTSQISQLERGLQGYSRETLAALAHALDIEVPDLFRDPEAPDYESWRIFKNLPSERKTQALRILEALFDDAVA